MRRPRPLLGIAVAIAIAPSAALAGPDALVPSLSPPGIYAGYAQGASTNLFFGVDYAYESDSSNVTREHIGDPTMNPNAPIQTKRDLVFHQYKHTITPHLEIGLLTDLWLYGALPIVIQQARELRLDTGVDKTTSSTFADGILPPGGFDARDPTTPPAGDLAFRGPDRHGLDQVHLGFGVAPMNQARDHTKPTWRIGAEARLAVGTVMKFDPMAPTANTGVSKGVDELKLWTTFDRRIGWAEPWLELFWQVPFATKSDSLFKDPGFGSTNTMLGQQAGVAFGMELFAIDDKEQGTRVSIDVGTRVIAHFEGRDYSEMWEAFALAGDARGSGPLILDSDPTTPGVQALSYPGISNIENYLETAAHFAVRAELGPHVRFAALTDLVWKTDHAITFADAGVDLPTCSATVTTHCETDNNTVINPGTAEVNPLHVPLIDLVGHRYHSEHNFGLVIGVQGQILF